MEVEPGRVLGADRTVGRFDLGVVEDRLAEQQVAVGCPDEVVQGVVRILAAESGEDVRSNRPCRRHRCRGQTEVRFFGDVDAVVGEHEGQRDVQVVGPDGRLVGLAVPVGVLEDDDLVVRFLAGIDVRVGGRAS